MGLFQRMSDIITANLNDLVDRWEDPEKMLKQAIREMETVINEARHETVRATASARLVQKNLAENERQAGAWQEKAEAAVRAGDDNAARKALVYRGEHAHVAAVLRDELEASTQASQKLRRHLEAMQAKLAEGRRKLATLVVRQKAAEVVPAWSKACPKPLWGQRPSRSSTRLRGKVERMEAEADALRELQGGGERCRRLPKQCSTRSGPSWRS